MKEKELLKKIIDKLQRAKPDIKGLGSGRVSWDQETYILKLSGEDLYYIIKSLKSQLAGIDDKSICKSCGQKMSLKSEPEYICMNPECECYCKTDEARKATMKDLQADDEAREERNYRLDYDKCGKQFWSNQAFPEPQICPSCYV